MAPGPAPWARCRGRLHTIQQPGKRPWQRVERRRHFLINPAQNNDLSSKTSRVFPTRGRITAPRVPVMTHASGIGSGRRPRSPGKHANPAQNKCFLENDVGTMQPGSPRTEISHGWDHGARDSMRCNADCAPAPRIARPARQLAAPASRTGRRPRSLIKGQPCTKQWFFIHSGGQGVTQAGQGAAETKHPRKRWGSGEENPIPSGLVLHETTVFQREPPGPQSVRARTSSCPSAQRRMECRRPLSPSGSLKA